MTTDERFSTPPPRRQCTSPPRIGRFNYSECYNGSKKHIMLPRCVFDDDDIINLNQPLPLSASSDTLSQYQLVCDYRVILSPSFDHTQGKKRSIDDVVTSEMDNMEVDTPGSSYPKSKCKKNN